MPTNIENLVCCLLNKTQWQNYFRVCPLLFNNSFNQQPDCWLIPKEIGIRKELKQPFVIKYVHKETATEAKSGSYRLLEGKVQVWFTFALSIEAVKQEDKDIFHSWLLWNNASINLSVQTSLWYHELHSFVYMPRSETCGSCIFNFQTFINVALHKDHSILYF